MIKKAGLMFGPVTIAAIAAISGALVIAVFWKLRGVVWGFQRKHIAAVSLLIIVGNIYPLITQTFLVNKIGHGFVGMMTCLGPICTVLISIPLLKIYPTKRQALGVLGGLGGIMIIMSDGFSRSIPFLYMLMAISVPFTYSLGNVIISRYFKNISPVSLALTAVGFTGLALLPAGLSLETVNMEANFNEAVFSLLLLGILGWGAGNVIFFDIIQKKGPLFAGMATYILPPLVLAWSWLDNEEITIEQLAAIAFILFMVWLTQSDMRENAI